MSKMIRLLSFSLLIMLFLSGCNSKETNSTDIFQYKDSYVGDNSAIGNIANQLPAAQHLNGFELKTNEEPYGIIFNYDWLATEEEYKETEIYNASFLFSLVKNLDWITFHFESANYTISRETLEKWYGIQLSEIESEVALTELIHDFLKDENKVNQLFK